jgi:hypothetical protein
MAKRDGCRSSPERKDRLMISKKEIMINLLFFFYLFFSFLIAARRARRRRHASRTAGAREPGVGSGSSGKWGGGAGAHGQHGSPLPLREYLGRGTARVRGRERREMHARPQCPAPGNGLAGDLAIVARTAGAAVPVRAGVPSRAAPSGPIGFDPAAAETTSVSRRDHPSVGGLGDGSTRSGKLAATIEWHEDHRARALGRCGTVNALCTGALTTTR